MADRRSEVSASSRVDYSNVYEMEQNEIARMVTNKPSDEPKRTPVAVTPVTQKSKANPLGRKPSNSEPVTCTNKSSTPPDEEVDPAVVSNKLQASDKGNENDTESTQKNTARLSSIEDSTPRDLSIRMSLTTSSITDRDPNIPTLHKKDLQFVQPGQTRNGGYLKKLATSGNFFSKGKYQERYFFINLFLKDNQIYCLEYSYGEVDEISRHAYPFEGTIASSEGEMGIKLNFANYKTIELLAATSRIRDLWFASIQRAIVVTQERAKYIREKSTNDLDFLIHPQRNSNFVSDSLVPRQIGFGTHNFPQQESVEESKSPDGLPVLTKLHIRLAEYDGGAKCGGQLNKKASKSSLMYKGKMQERFFYIKLNLKSDQNYVLEYTYTPEDTTPRDSYPLAGATVFNLTGNSFQLSTCPTNGTGGKQEKIKIVVLEAYTAVLRDKWMITLQRAIDVANARARAFGLNLPVSRLSRVPSVAVPRKQSDAPRKLSDAPRKLSDASNRAPPSVLTAVSSNYNKASMEQRQQPATTDSSAPLNLVPLSSQHLTSPAEFTPAQRQSVAKASTATPISDQRLSKALSALSTMNAATSRLVAVSTNSTTEDEIPPVTSQLESNVVDIPYGPSTATTTGQSPNDINLSRAGHSEIKIIMPRPHSSALSAPKPSETSSHSRLTDTPTVSGISTDAGPSAVDLRKIFAGVPVMGMASPRPKKTTDNGNDVDTSRLSSVESASGSDKGDKDMNLPTTGRATIAKGTRKTPTVRKLRSSSDAVAE